MTLAHVFMTVRRPHGHAKRHEKSTDAFVVVLATTNVWRRGPAIVRHLFRCQRVEHALDIQFVFDQLAHTQIPLREPRQPKTPTKLRQITDSCGLCQLNQARRLRGTLRSQQWTSSQQQGDPTRLSPRLRRSTAVLARPDTS